MNKDFVRLIILCTFLILVPSGLLPAADKKVPPSVKDIIVTTSDTDLLLFATVENGFTPKMLTSLHNGVPIVFTFHLELVKIKRTWLNTTLVDSTVTHTMTWDEQRQEYRVSLSEKEGKDIVTRNFKQASRRMAELNGAKVIALDRLIPDAPYAIHFKVTLMERDLPLGLHRIVPFSSLWNIETDSRTIEFRF
ncbi:DUF4390 domain-containing protein [Desulfobulbus alkaliphilus]|uniref:DUF4390 domain-containing protein n=1 Tax=Desulfobulbus alkaliphilus TaxID=869814 RepID=UPI0019652A6A|nr:DUF4390 domain-containing protein [Desulfobulbus alkaliphilus]MBM9536987.1 DUF4390 domain-containing protein [Desulfobulbus alkaliphilus]